MSSLWKTTLIVAAIALFSSTHQAQSRFRLTITVPDTDRPEFSVPGVGGMFALIPALADKSVNRSKSRPTLIRVTPIREGNAIRLIVSVLYGKVDKNEPIYDQLKDFKEKSVAEFLVVGDEKVSVSELKRFGVKPIEIKVVPDNVAPDAQL